MLLSNLVTTLNALPIVHSVSMEWTIKNTIWGMELVTIPFLRTYPNGVLTPDTIEVAVAERNTSNEQVYWWKSVPAILREPETPVRQPYYSNAVYKTGIEAEFSGWTILQLTIQVQGVFDKANITAIHPETDLIVYKQLLIWKEGTQPRWKMIDDKSV